MPGDKAPVEVTRDLRYVVRTLLNRNNNSFPGAQPVSFGSEHLLKLQEQDYYVCEKTDGIRCLMYLTQGTMNEEVVYLIDRNNEYYHVQDLHFPLEGDNPAAFHTRTILDGELVIDTDPKTEESALKYLVFDCLIMDGKNLMGRSLDKRLAYFRQQLLSPYEALYKRYPEELQYVPFTIHFKHQEFGYAMDQVFNRIIPNLHHGNDGLIFTCVNSPYTPGTDPHILKWKAANENTIDFRMHLNFPMIEPDEDEDDGPYPDYNALPQVDLTVDGGSVEGDVDWGTLALSAEEWEGMKEENRPLNERIVECYMDDGNWRYLRFREDKSESNYIRTAKGVMASIADEVTKEDLISHEKLIKVEWKKRADEAKREAAATARKEAEARREAQARKSAKDMSAPNGDCANGVGGTKRKFEGNEQEPD